jgi:hypothetical protein
MAVVDLSAWSRCLDVPAIEISHALGATWANAEELYHLARRQQIGLQDCPDSELVDAVDALERAQCLVLTRLDELRQAVRPEVG